MEQRDLSRLKISSVGHSILIETTSGTTNWDFAKVLNRDLTFILGLIRWKGWLVWRTLVWHWLLSCSLLLVPYCDIISYFVVSTRPLLFYLSNSFSFIYRLFNGHAGRNPTRPFVTFSCQNKLIYRRLKMTVNHTKQQSSIVPIEDPVRVHTSGKETTQENTSIENLNPNGQDVLLPTL